MLIKYKSMNLQVEKQSTYLEIFVKIFMAKPTMEGGYSASDMVRWYKFILLNILHCVNGSLHR